MILKNVFFIIVTRSSCEPNKGNGKDERSKENCVKIMENHLLGPEKLLLIASVCQKKEFSVVCMHAKLFMTKGVQCFHVQCLASTFEVRFRALDSCSTVGCFLRGETTAMSAKA